MAPPPHPAKPRAAQKQGVLGRWYGALAGFDVAAVFHRPHVPGPPRTVFVHEPLPADYRDKKGRVKKEHAYITNQVITSKYTVLTFLPRNLLEQFRRVANIFFAAIAILQFFHEFSTVSPGLVILPLLVVLAITALKDGYEDIKRHQSDKRVNQSQVRVLSGGGWANPNGSGAKARTFVRGLVPKGKGGRGGATDVEMQVRGAPAGAVAAAAEDDDDIGRDHDERSFDDEENNVEEHRGHMHIGGYEADARPHWRKTSWEDVRVGDFLRILDNEALPADVLICATSEDENVAYVETKNLDGETNLKSRNAVPALTHLRTARACADPAHAFRVECDRPDVNMYKLNAAVVGADGARAPVELPMTLLRGTVLRNTGWVIGLVLFTGEDTKIVLNSGGTPSKRSRVERQMNPQVFINLALLAVIATVCAIVDSTLEKKYYPRNAPWLFADDQKDNNPRVNGLITWAFALIVFQNIVPISLYISIEGVRTLQAAFIYFDSEIWYKKLNQPTLARSWNLSDDLGQIEYIFSDKTGTLTQNSMVFRECSVGGRVYHGDENTDASMDSDEPLKDTPTAPMRSKASGSRESADAATDTTRVPDPMQAEGAKLPPGVLGHFKDSRLAAELDAAVQGTEDAAWSRSLNGFFSVLALCHTVLASADPVTGALEYKAQSPDEAALVQAAADVGFVFRGRERELLRLQTPFADEPREFELLNILEFTSARKRMSVVVRSLEDGRLFLLTKGADNIIFERLKPGEEDLKRVTTQHLDAFANEGLRTLTLAYKVVSEEYYADWSHRYHEATTLLDEREEKIEEVSDELERDLRLLGATAIEDRLQDGVPETIADLKRAGIKIWVATGDKLETAIAIGHSTNLIQKDSNIVVVRGNGEQGRPVYAQMLRAVEEFFPESDILTDDAVDRSALDDGTERAHPVRVNSGMSEVVGQDNGERPGGFVLVVDGAALTQAFADDVHQYLLLRLAVQCEGVICCRVSPKQKAQITRLVREGLGVMTLAIGDGANDVSMIQAADVGVGISGEEGLQAVNSSDYAIAQFRFLKRLLFVHGHWSYARNGTMIVNFFYKNMVVEGVLFWFQFYCGWSSAYVMDYTYLLFWNSFWTIAPVIALGLFDRIVDDDVLMAIPELYSYGRKGHWFGTKIFLLYMFEALYQSAVVFFFTRYAYGTTTARTDGFDVYIYEMSTPMVLAAVMVADLHVGLNTKVWTWWVFFAVALGICLVWIWTAVYSAVSPGWIVTFVYGDNHFLFLSAYFYLTIFLTIILALAPRYIAKALKFGFYPDDLDILRYNRKMNPGRDIGRDAYTGGRLAELKHSASRASHASGVDVGRPSMDARLASRTDMSTGMRSVHRGFDFITEEDGVAMRRIQTNLSERRVGGGTSPRKRSTTLLRSLKQSLRRKRSNTTASN